LPEHGARYPRELSGGQRQRVGLARALALDPSHLLLDEPFGALDPIIRGELQRDLSALWRELGKTVVIVTHDLREAFMLGDSVALMHAGKVVQHGTERELRELPASDFVAQFVAGCDA
jgi:osmoprotectant transport system ATP-binding protein